MTLQTPTTQTQYQQHLSYYGPDFDETLNVGSWEHLGQIPNVIVTFFRATFVLVIFVHIKNISGLSCYRLNFDQTLKVDSKKIF